MAPVTLYAFSLSRRCLLLWAREFGKARKCAFTWICQSKDIEMCRAVPQYP